MIRDANYKDFVELSELFKEFLDLNLHDNQYNLCLMQWILVHSFYDNDLLCAVIQEDGYLADSKTITGFWLGYKQVDESLFILSVYSKKPLLLKDFKFIEDSAISMGAKQIIGIMKKDNKFCNELLMGKYGFESNLVFITKKVGEK